MKQELFMNMANEISIKETSLTDDVLRTLIAFSGNWEKENSCHGYRKNEISDIEPNRIFIAVCGNKTVGYLFGNIRTAEKTTSVMKEGTAYFEVEELYVQPAFRNKGIGRKLFGFAETAVAGQADFIMLSTATKNWKAILHFYIDELGMEFWNARLFKRIKMEEDR